VDGDLVIVSAAISSWGTQANRAHRFIALDKRTGDIVWVATPGGRPYDTAYALPLIATINGTRLLISDTGDGAIHAIEPQTGDIKTTKWAVKGDQFGFSSPVIDGTRVYQIENGSRLKAFDLETGRELWRLPLGTVQKAPLVMADGKLYVGTESGKFFIVRPGADRAEILSEVELPKSLDDNAGQSVAIPEPVFGGA